MQCYKNLGTFYGNFGFINYNKAIEHFLTSLNIAKEIGNKEEEARCYKNLAEAYRYLGDLKSEIKFLSKEQNILEKIGQLHYLKVSRRKLSSAYKRAQKTKELLDV